MKSNIQEIGLTRRLTKGRKVALIVKSGNGDS